ncbi:putative NAD(P)H nitroreductase [bioreactor metagenome]|uniref:Putative NAD(P)H nitroreductase n=1 Tax=bioreactor metagenome TaxID=1076179 RepID=A0A644T7Y8_9ZZZZ|nr:nitroreductase family protein [Candidatus Elulimicrobiales bacterium]
MSFLENLNWRYATKRFDTTKKVKEEDVKKIREAIRMTPTSLGVQMFHVVEVVSQDLKDKLRAISFDQEQMSTADRIFVFCARKDLADRTEEMFMDMTNNDEEFRKNDKDISQYEKSVKFFAGQLGADRIPEWSAREAHIVLGFALAACAELKIDSCPVGGFDPVKAKEILNMDLDFMPVVCLPIGYRDETDEHLKFKKWRFPEDKIFEKM